jgi:hypothetical protein
MTQTTVTHKGNTLTVTQEPYIDRVHVRIGDTVEMIEGTVYRAAAEDAEGNGYQVYWTRLTPDQEVADWDTYTVLPA